MDDEVCVGGERRPVALEKLLEKERPGISRDDGRRQDFRCAAACRKTVFVGGDCRKRKIWPVVTRHDRQHAQIDDQKDNRDREPQKYEKHFS